MKHLSQIFLVLLLLLSVCTENKPIQTDTKQVNTLLAEVQKTLATDSVNDKAIALLEEGMKEIRPLPAFSSRKRWTYVKSSWLKPQPLMIRYKKPVT